MSPLERASALRSLTSHPNGAGVEAEIRALEQRYEMTSAKMLKFVKAGQLDTADTARWLVLLSARGR